MHGHIGHEVEGVDEGANIVDGGFHRADGDVSGEVRGLAEALHALTKSFGEATTQEADGAGQRVGELEA